MRLGFATRLVGFVNFLLLSGLMPTVATAQLPVWSGLGNNAQHTAISTVPSQSMDGMRWSTPVDLAPEYDGYDLNIHYGTPMSTAQNTIIVPMKTGTANTTSPGIFQVSAFNGTNGSLLWTQTSDYVLPYNDWTPSYSPTLTPQGGMYFPGPGGTVYYRTNLNGAGAVTPTQFAFYGTSNYQNNPSAFDNVKIETPITSDSSGNIYFGFNVRGDNSAGLTSGIARISASGQGSWVSANAAALGASYIADVQQNCAPALSNDGKTLYMAVTGINGDNEHGDLVALDSTTLLPKKAVELIDPSLNIPAGVRSVGTASPTVGPDGRVFFGVQEGAPGFGKGYLLQFSGDLSTSYTPGPFGWDVTPSIVPASMVKSYTGNSSYLVLTKNNDYVSNGGSGQHKVSIFDPNASESFTTRFNGPVTVMKEVVSVLNPVPSEEFAGAVTEWCLNTAAVDPATDSIIANDEAGTNYRWDLNTNTLSQSVNNAEPIGSAYTPTIIGADGTTYAINNAHLYATTAFQWTNPGSAAWSATSSWFGPLPDGAGSKASLLNSTTGATTVTLDGSRTVGSLNFDSPYGYVLAGQGSSTLTLSQTGGAGPSITVSNVRGNGAHTISAPLIIAGSMTVTQNSSGPLTIAAPIDDGGGGYSLTTAGTGTIILAASNTYSGGTSIGQGSTLQLGTGSAIGTIVGNINDNGTAAFAPPLAGQLFAGVISGSGRLSQLGPGMQILTAGNSYSGGTVITAGTLQIGNGGNIGSISGSVATSGVLAFNRSDNFTFASAATGPGSLAQMGQGTLTLTGPISSNVAANAGRIVVSAAGMISGDLAIAAGASVLSNNAAPLQIGSLTNSGTLIGSAEPSGSFINQQTGDVRIGAGQRFYLQSGNAQTNGGLIEVIGSQYYQAQVETAAPFTNSASVPNLGGSSPTINAAYSTMYFDAGLDNQGTIGISKGLSDVFGNVANESGALINVTGSSGVTFWGDVTQNGTVSVATNSSVLFLGALTGSGSFSGGGDVYISNDLRPNGGAIVGQPPEGSPVINAAALAFGGNVHLTPTTNTVVRLAGSAGGGVYDAIQVAGAIELGGSLTVALADPSYRPSHGAQFQILSFGTQSGAFATVSGLDLGNRLQLVPKFGSNNLTLTAVQGGSGNWNVDANGSISAPGNWSSGLPNAAGDVATFGPAITAPRTVTIDQPIALGAIDLQSSAGYTLAGNATVILQNSGSNSLVHTKLGNQVIAAPLDLESDTVVQIDSGSLTLSGSVNGAAGLRKAGPGSLILSDIASYAGATTFNSGTVYLTKNGALPQGTSLTVHAGATLIFGGMPSQAPAAESSISAVPEPSAFVLLQCAFLIGLGIHLARAPFSQSEATS